MPEKPEYIRSIHINTFVVRCTRCGRCAAPHTELVGTRYVTKDHCVECHQEEVKEERRQQMFADRRAANPYSPLSVGPHMIHRDNGQLWKEREVAASSAADCDVDSDEQFGYRTNAYDHIHDHDLDTHGYIGHLNEETGTIITVTDEKKKQAIQASIDQAAGEILRKRHATPDANGVANNYKRQLPRALPDRGRPDRKVKKKHSDYRKAKNKVSKEFR